MTSHKPINSQLPLVSYLFEACNSLLQPTNSGSSIFGKSVSLKSLFTMKAIRLQMPWMVIIGKAKTAIQQKQQEIVKVLSALSAGLIIVYLVAFNQSGIVSVPGFFGAGVIAINILVFIYSGSQKNLHLQKELLEKIATLEEYISLSEEQREKLKKTVLFKEKLISVISHDIRVPINSFRFLIENYERGYLTDKMVLDGIIETKKDLIKVDNMVIDLVNWSKNEKSENEQQVVSYQQFHDVVESVLSVYTLCAKNKKLDIVPVIDIPEGMNLSIQRRELEIILRNLLSNAIKFSNTENKIMLTMKANAENPSSATLSVRDFGKGMHPTVLERLNGNRVISTMGTMNEVGLGVGLSIVFDVIHSRNLTYNIQSETGKGTKFSVNVPLVSCQS